MEKILSDFKRAGHRLAHIFADGWSTGSHKRKMTLLEAPTGTLLFYYKDIKQEIVQTLLLEVFGVSKKWVIIMDRRQDLKCDFDSSRKKWTFGSGPLLCQRFWRRREETTCKLKRIEISLVLVKIMLHVLTYVVSKNCFGIEMVLCDLYLKRFDLTKGLLFKTFVITVWYKLCRCDRSVLKFKSISLLMNW